MVAAPTPIAVTARRRNCDRRSGASTRMRGPSTRRRSTSRRAPSTYRPPDRLRAARARQASRWPATRGRRAEPKPGRRRQAPTGRLTLSRHSPEVDAWSRSRARVSHAELSPLDHRLRSAHGRPRADPVDGSRAPLRAACGWLFDRIGGRTRVGLRPVFGRRSRWVAITSGRSPAVTRQPPPEATSKETRAGG
jgi:hypothetical protein